MPHRGSYFYASEEKGVQGVGVDADQGYLGEHILTSAQKKVDVAVETAIKSVQDGSYKGGADVIFDLKNDGVGLGALGPAGTKYEAQAAEIAEKIKSGEISDIPSTVD